MVAVAHLGRLECDVPNATETPDGHRQVLRFHHVAALADRSHGFRGSHRGRSTEDCGRGHREGGTEASTGICGDCELDTVLDGNLPCVANFVAARAVPGILARHQNCTDAQG